MEPKTISAEFTVCAQITPDDVAAIAAKGFAAIICNRPDGEGVGQPPFAEIEAAAKMEGIVVAYQPITPGQCGADQARAFRALIAALPQPVFAYCRTGTRSTTLWALAQVAMGQDASQIAARTAAAGYDVTAALGAAADKI
jgi:sulfide:quinone oxidoreductase